MWWVRSVNAAAEGIGWNCTGMPLSFEGVDRRCGPCGRRAGVLRCAAGRDRALALPALIGCVVMKNTLNIVVWVSCFGCVLAWGCNRDSSKKNSANGGRGSDSAVTIVWAPDAKCKNKEVNDFVAKAMTVCAEGDYEEYRLLWSLDHQPTNRKRFMQLRDAMQKVDVKTIRRLQFRLPDGSMKGMDTPVYVLHAFVALKEEAKQRSERLKDRDLILQIVRRNDAWCFIPAAKEVKKSLLAGKSGQPAVVPPDAVPTQPAPGGGSD